MRRVGRLVVVGLSLALIGLGGVVVRDIAATSPALSEELRITVAGTWRPSARSHLYDRSRYAGERVEVLLTNAAPTETTPAEASSIRAAPPKAAREEPSEAQADPAAEAATPLPTPETVDDALRLSLDAVETAPADAYAWTLLAASAWASGFDVIARSALLRSHELAPTTADLALERLALAGLYGAEPSAAERAALRDDVAVARMHRGAALKELLDTTPELRALLGG